MRSKSVSVPATPTKAKGAAGGGATLLRDYSDNGRAQILFGPHNVHLEKIERHLGVHLGARGNSVAISGPPEDSAEAARVLDDLYELAGRQGHLETADIDMALRQAAVVVQREHLTGFLVRGQPHFLADGRNDCGIKWLGVCEAQVNAGEAFRFSATEQRRTRVRGLSEQ